MIIHLLALFGFLVAWPALVLFTFHQTAVLIFGERPPPPEDPDDDHRGP